MSMTIHMAAKSAQTKIDLLTWIGLLPEPHATLNQLEIRAYRKGLADEELASDERSYIEQKIPMINQLMDEGLQLVSHKLNTSECVECGKCDDLRDVVQMLLTEHDIDEVNTKIKDHFGDIEKSKNRGMPGHQSDGPGLQVRGIPTEGQGGGLGALLNLLGEMIESMPHDEEIPDKDKLH